MSTCPVVWANSNEIACTVVVVWDCMHGHYNAMSSECRSYSVWTVNTCRPMALWENTVLCCCCVMGHVHIHVLYECERVREADNTIMRHGVSILKMEFKLHTLHNSNKWNKIWTQISWISDLIVSHFMNAGTKQYKFKMKIHVPIPSYKWNRSGKLFQIKFNSIQDIYHTCNQQNLKLQKR